MLLRRNIKLCLKRKTKLQSRPTLETLIAKQMASYIKHKTCWNKNPTAISDENNIKRSYPSVNALNCLENLYAAILPSASQVNTRRDFQIFCRHLEIKSEITRSRVNQSDQ